MNKLFTIYEDNFIMKNEKGIYINFKKNIIQGRSLIKSNKNILKKELYILNFLKNINDKRKNINEGKNLTDKN